MLYCKYYQALISDGNVSFFVATLRAHEHLAFDRTLNKTVNLFEFYVPEERSFFFEELLTQYQLNGVITSWSEHENRLKNPQEEL